MLEKLLTDGIMFGALSINSLEWDDNAGKNFHTKLDTIIRQEKESVSNIVKCPAENAEELCLDIRNKEAEFDEKLSQMRNDIYRIKEQLEAFSV